MLQIMDKSFFRSYHLRAKIGAEVEKAMASPFTIAPLTRPLPSFEDFETVTMPTDRQDIAEMATVPMVSARTYRKGKTDELVSSLACHCSGMGEKYVGTR